MRSKFFLGFAVFLLVMVLCSLNAKADEVYGDYVVCRELGDTYLLMRYTGSDVNVTIPSKINGKSVVLIDNFAFADHKELKSVVIPDTVTKIGYAAFQNCENLDSVSIPDSVTVISRDAFDNTKIANDTKGKLVYVDKWLVECKDKNQPRVKIKKGTVGIANETFFASKKLVDVTVPNSVRWLGVNTFLYCENLRSINIPDNVTIIDEAVFGCCINLSTVTIPQKVTSIGSLAFSSCKSLTSVTIPDSVKSIGNKAFSGCVNLADVNIPGSVKSIGKQAFLDTKIVDDQSGDLAYIDKWLVSCKNKDITSVNIKRGTSGIADSVFSGCKMLETVKIPKGVKSIGAYAFSECARLKSVTLPSSVRTICDYAFRDCQSLEKITLKNGVRSVGLAAFSGCERLSSINIPGSVKSIKANAFDNTGIVNVQKGDLIYVGDWLVACKNKKITSAKIKSGAVGIAGSVFGWGYKGLISISVPSSVRYICDYAFIDCVNLKNIYYKGSETDWKKIAVGVENPPLYSAVIQYNIKS